MARAAVVEQPQEALPGAQPGTTLDGGQVIEDADLVRLLEDREKRRRTLASYRKAFRSTDEAAKVRIKELGLKGEARCAGFIVTVKERKGRSVAFDVAAGETIRIRPVAEEE